MRSRQSLRAIARAADRHLKPSLSRKTQMAEPADDFVKAWEKAAKVARAFGDSTGELAPHPDEKLLPYRQRLASKYIQHSRTFKGSSLAGLNCPVAMTGVEDSIFADAMQAFNSGSTVPAGQLRAITKVDATGRPITRYVGSDGACWDQFNPAPRYVRRFMTP